MNKQFKQFISALLIGVLFLSTGTFVSCSDDDYGNRITVLEQLLRELREAVDGQLFITTATQGADGGWLLVLSDGRQINTGVGGGGNGSGVNVVMGDHYATITVAGDPPQTFTIPLGSGTFTLVYAPDYADGEVRLPATGRANVTFLVRPALTTAQQANATFHVVSAREVQTRSASFFEVDGNPTFDGNYVTIPFLATEGSEGARWAIAIEMRLNGGAHLSNFFNVVVPEELQGMEENLSTPDFASDIVYSALGNDIYTAVIPSTVDFLSEDGIDFTEFMDVPTGAIFRIGARGEQNNHMNDSRFNIFRASLNDNGTFVLTGRLGHAMNNSNAYTNDGFLVNVIYNDEIVHKVHWTIVDPFADLDNVFFGGSLAAGGEPNNPDRIGQEVEWGYRDGIYLFPGVNEPINIPYLLGMEDPNEFFLLHTGGGRRNMFAAVQAYNITMPDGGIAGLTGNIIHFDRNAPGGFVLGDAGEAMMGPGSRGVWWRNEWTGMAVSGRRNWPEAERPTDADGRYNSIGPLQPIPGGTGNALLSRFGIEITEDGLIITHENFLGHGWRIAPGVRFEYAFGNRNIGNYGGTFVHFWVNRRHMALTEPRIQDPTVGEGNVVTFPTPTFPPDF